MLNWNTEGGEHSCPLSQATSGKDRAGSSLPGELGPPLHTCLSLGLLSCCLRWQEAFPELLRDGFVGKRDKKDIKGEPSRCGEEPGGGGGLNPTPAVGGDQKADWWGCAGP